MRIGFIGLGIMGRPMAQNLVKAGFSLTVFNRTRARTEPLAAAGAAVADSPARVARASDVVITIVSDTPDVEAVLFGSDGLFHGLTSTTTGGVTDTVTGGKIVIDMSTISPEATVDFARRLAEKDCEMLDAPVSGGEKGAIEATLSIMVGGRREIFDRCLPIFNAMGKTIAYTGQNGNGQRTKLVNQIICASNIVSMVEGLRFARLAGLDMDTTLKLVSSGAAASWMLSNLAPRILNSDFAPGFMIKLQQKDLRLVRETIQKIGASFPGTELAFKLFTEAVAEGLGEQGTQGLINLPDA